MDENVLYEDLKSVGYNIMNALRNSFRGSELITFEDGGCYQKLRVAKNATIFFQEWGGGKKPFYIIVRGKDTKDHLRNSGLLQLDLSHIVRRQKGRYYWYLHKPKNKDMEKFYEEYFDEMVSGPRSYVEAVRKQKDALQPDTRLYSELYRLAKDVSLDTLCDSVTDLLADMFRERKIPVSLRKNRKISNDSGKRRKVEVTDRPNQSTFRELLLQAYSCECAIVSEGPIKALDAAHIYNHSESLNNQVENGLLLRADIHKLFDDGFIKINPQTYKVEVDPTLKDTSYWSFNGKEIRKTIYGQYPSQEFLKIKYEE